MIRFRCWYQGDEAEDDDWEGYIQEIKFFESHYEILIISRSSIRIIIGKSSLGNFICIPDFQAGCKLSRLKDTFFNSEQLIYAMESPVDGTTVACALNALADVIKLD
jgi:hypothetical protein